ncbi:leucine-rich repeats and immunoglobulin-like domains protein 3 [Leptopilina heterotoma]|uniref:leucine-rich repeats and immunoglobulin-like domains protein 3 n=1 Tax=Leptopilina heterotoma TaxID=63436 RepID=UPI001CAA1E4B|nr:leucine-rich repeats and immunoglobulin-like domains protein 3 [Leptopilina heterotoma]
MAMRTILWCLLIKIFIINGSSANDCLLKNNELNNHETANEEFQLCKDEQIVLNFSKTTITKLEENFLTNTLLSCLKINNKGITKVSSTAFDKMPNLTYLNLANNSIEEDDLLIEGNLQNLKILILDSAYNLNDGFAKEITLRGYYPSLEKLYLRNNDILLVKLEGLVFHEDNFSKLTHLYLNNNSIVLFNNPIAGGYTAVKYINLNNNNLLSVQVNLPALEFLSFNYNQVWKLALIGTKKLVELYAAHNKLYEFTEESLQECEKLKILDLKNNEITKFSRVIFEKCISLEYLNLDNNEISEIPVVNSTSYLKRFSLRWNRINSLRPDTFSLMPHLIVLRLDGNRIFKVEANTFLTLVNLQSLTLGNNQLANLPENWSKNLRMLKNLNLENNKFKMLEDLSLKQEDVILKLNLTDNPLEQLTRNSFMFIPENTTVYLSSNASGVESCVRSN